MNWTAQTLHHQTRGNAVGHAETLVAIHDEARRERLLDMETRLRPYRVACFAILAISLAIGGSQVGWLWVVPLLAGLAGFAVADHYMSTSPHPAIWVAGAWAALSVLLGVAVLVTGKSTSPVLVWFALPAVTLGFASSPAGWSPGRSSSWRCSRSARWRPTRPRRWNTARR